MVVTEAESKAKKATITDVAQLAGVSVGTVSRYINGQHLRSSNRAQVERAIEALSFQPSSSARAMKLEKTQLIGFLVRELDQFHATLLQMLSREFQAQGFTMLTYCHGDRSGDVKGAVDFFSAQRVDALVVSGSSEVRSAVEHVAGTGTPIITFNNDLLGLNVDRVFVDNRRASLRAVEHLLDLGHTRIAHIAGHQGDSAGLKRAEGYREAMEARGLPLNPAYLQQAEWRTDAGYMAMEGLMALPEPPTAIFTANFRMAYGVLEWAQQHEKQTPRDFSLVSFDDTELFRLAGTGISAIAQPVERIAQTIVECATIRLGDSDVPATTTRRLQCDMILRGSTRPPNPTP